MPITPEEANEKFTEREKFIKENYDRQCKNLFDIIDYGLGQHNFNENKIFSINVGWHIKKNCWAIEQSLDKLFFIEEIKKTYEKLGWHIIIKMEYYSYCKDLEVPVLYFSKKPIKIQKKYWGLSEKMVIDE